MRKFSLDGDLVNLARPMAATKAGRAGIPALQKNVCTLHELVILCGARGVGPGGIALVFAEYVP